MFIYYFIAGEYVMSYRISLRAVEIGNIFKELVKKGHFYQYIWIMKDAKLLKPWLILK